MQLSEIDLLVILLLDLSKTESTNILLKGKVDLRILK